jgi:hypothetical protein
MTAKGWRTPHTHGSTKNASKRNPYAKIRITPEVIKRWTLDEKWVTKQNHKGGKT